MPIQLPATPTDQQYEDYVTATVFALGYFTETQIHFAPKSTDVLEIDTVATPSGDRFLHRKLIEAKAGGWGFPDVFKIFGWMTYLAIQEGHIAHSRDSDAKKTESLVHVQQSVPVKTYHLKIDPKSGRGFIDPCRKIAPGLYRLMMSAAWYQQIAIRKALTAFIRRYKSAPSDDLDKAKAYRRALDNSFFEPDPIRRIHQLYEAWQAAPRLSSSLVASIAKAGDVDAAWKSVKDTSEHLWLQYVMYLEHRARIAIIKTGLEYALRGGASLTEFPTDFFSTPEDMDRLYATLTPGNFRRGVESLRAYEHSRRVPYFFQVYLELFGGFLHCSDTNEREMLATITGVPAADIDTCLAFYDTFFPMEKGWRFKSKGEIESMKLVPGFIRGGGAIWRHLGWKMTNYGTRFRLMGFLLVRWHNLFSKLVSPDLKVEAKTQPDERAR